MAFQLEIPSLDPGVAAEWKCYAAKPKDMRAIHLPEQRVDGWQKRALEKFEEVLLRMRSLQVYLDICAQCGACADKCQFYLGTGDPNNMPVQRANLLRKVYRYYFTTLGKLFGKAVGAEPLTEEVLKEWYTYFYQCSECRRCSAFCPYGIDTAEITIAAREILSAVGVATKYVTEVVAKVYETGNNLGIPPAAWIDNCQFLEEELLEETGQHVRLPVDEEGAEVLLVPPSADNFANTDTMMGYAKMFHVAGISWTTSTYCNEAGNFGLFLNYRNLKQVNKRILDAARMLKVKKVIWGE
ncbi:MAG: (Fe-S)-binding protein [Anaerolineae bacterium]